MKPTICLFILVSLYTNLRAQESGPSNHKPLLDTSVYATWLWVDNPQISDDGNYAAYEIRSSLGGSLKVRSRTGWEVEIANPTSTSFSTDSKKLFCLSRNRVLSVVDLASGKISANDHVASFKLFFQGGAQWLAYVTDSVGKTLTLQDLATGHQRIFYGVDDYLITTDGKAVVLKTEQKTNAAVLFTLNWASLSDSDAIQVWSDAGVKKKISDFVLDTSGTQLAFLVENENDGKEIFIYDRSSAKTNSVFNSRRDGLPAGFELGDIKSFSLDRTRLFISLQKIIKKCASPPIVPLEIWNYQDAMLQGDQEKRVGRPHDFAAIIGISDHHVLLLQQDNETPFEISGPKDDYVLMDASQGTGADLYWSQGSQPSAYIVSTVTGARTHLSLLPSELSPDGLYLVCKDPKTYDLYSYEFSSGKIIEITSAASALHYIIPQNLNKGKPYLSEWLGNAGHLLLVFDQFDIWRIDLSDVKNPINLTNGYGYKHHIEFRLAENPQFHSADDHLLVSAFDKVKKLNGFYRVNLTHREDPVLLTMDNCLYYHPFIGGMMPIKAIDTGVFLIERQNVAHSPNYYWTEDFKTFTLASNVFPEAKYNWLTSELTRFKMTDGTPEDAVIYKPEDFDAARKYPIILTYYEERSDRVNKYFSWFMDGYNFNIPWFTSHGYVVIVPDIKYQTGKTGASALKYVLATADYCQTLPWADAGHIGICGQSFGGFETNYIVTHTKRFAAAISNSGVSDAILDYLSLWNEGSDKIDYMEKGQGRMDKTLWEDPARYLENSPLLSANKIVTPLFMVANRKDGNVSYMNGQELFLAMRRMGKRVWMLQYDKEYHGVKGGNEFIDYTLRSQQFFDFYLKGTAAPVWMVEGVPAAKKQLDSGLELEAIRKIPGPGLLTPEEQKKVDLLQNRKPVTVTIQ